MSTTSLHNVGSFVLFLFFVKAIHFQAIFIESSYWVFLFIWQFYLTRNVFFVPKSLINCAKCSILWTLAILVLEYSCKLYLIIQSPQLCRNFFWMHKISLLYQYYWFSRMLEMEHMSDARFCKITDNQKCVAHIMVIRRTRCAWLSTALSNAREAEQKQINKIYQIPIHLFSANRQTSNNKWISH